MLVGKLTVDENTEHGGSFSSFCAHHPRKSFLLLTALRASIRRSGILRDSRVRAASSFIIGALRDAIYGEHAANYQTIAYASFALVFIHLLGKNSIKTAIFFIEDDPK